MSTNDHNPRVDQFLGDSPLQDPKLDQFARWPFARRIAETIALRTDSTSIVVGIYGEWGDGKTTVLNYIRVALGEFSHVIPVYFNPWRFSGEDELLNSFFKTLSEALGRSLSKKKEEIGKIIGRYANLIAPVYSGVSDAATVIGRALSEVDIDELKSRVEQFLSEEGKRVVVFMDDIDRLDKSEIQAVFRIVKLSADFKYLAYVLAFDEKMVAAALQEKYAAADERAGYNFLEKIVQVPLNLPPAKKSALERICFQGIDEALRLSRITLEERQVHEFWRAFYDGLTIRLRTPRMAKRYVNAISFALPILRGEVNPIELMLIEGIRVFYPSLYRHIRENPESYLCKGTTNFGFGDEHIQKRNHEIRENGLAGLTPEEKSAAHRLITILFPRTSNTNYSSEWDLNWANEQRIASSDYFNRYFTYSIPESDLSDNELASFLSALSEMDDEKLLLELRRLAVGNEEVFIRKLRAKEEKFSERESIKLATSIAALGEIFPNPEQITFFTTPLIQAAIFIRSLLKNVSQSKRFIATEIVLNFSRPLFFTYECFRWIQSTNDKSEENKLFSEEELSKLRKLIAERIKEETKRVPLYHSMPRYAPALFYLWAWGLSKEETNEFLSQRFDEHPSEAIDFIKTFLPTAWGIAGIPRKGDLRRDQYDTVISIVNGDIIYSKLIEQFGPEIVSDKYVYLEDHHGKFAESLAKQYCFIHKVATTEKQRTETVPNK